jgi:hypothetical protein
LQLGPLLIDDVEHECFARHRVLASVASSTTEENNFLFGNYSHRVAEPCLGDFAINLNILYTLVALVYDWGFLYTLATAFSTFHYDVTAKPSWLLVVANG